MRKIIVGSRRSNLAMTQTKWFIEQMKEAGVPFEFEIKEIVTKGDQILDVMLSKVGGKGLFVKEIQQALFNKEIDFAVHSMKDMPSELPEGLVIGCIPPRVDARDAFISNGHVKFMDLPVGAVVGTSSLRRSSQLLLLRPDLEIKWIRGNIDTRLKKLHDGEYDAILLAAAGMKRIGWDPDLVTEFMSVEDCIPAVGQGALAIECRSDDTELLAELAKISDDKTWKEVEAERTFLSEMNGSCQVPIAGYAEYDGTNINFTGYIASPDATEVFKQTIINPDPVEAGKQVAKTLRAQGASEVIEKVLAEMQMKDSEPLKGKTVVFTGTPKSTDVFELVEQYGGKPVSLPLIQVEELIEPTDKLRLEACPTYDWLIFTSQSAVSAFEAKLIRHDITADSISSNVAAIGTRTAAALEKIGFSVQFIPTVFSADVFVKEFKPTENDLRRLLFLRGSIAGPTISEELPFEVDEWTVYKTDKVVENAKALSNLLQQEKEVALLFASPSAVQRFAEDVSPSTGWDGFTIGAIGHVTEKALVKVGAPVHVRPDTYTLKDLVIKLANRKDVTIG